MDCEAAPKRGTAAQSIGDKSPHNRLLITHQQAQKKPAILAGLFFAAG